MTSPPVRSDDPPLAYHDLEFLDSDEARPLRMLAEYLQPMRCFEHELVQDTVVFFGSARLDEHGPMGRYYAEARELARALTEWSLRMDSGARRFVVCTGGGGGIMEAANRGAADAGGRSIGLNIGLPHEQRPNAWITPGLSFEFHYFFMRKLWFAHLARAIIAFPGGFGTLDELFEAVTLVQTRRTRPCPIVLLGAAYWSGLVDWLRATAVARGAITAAELALLRLADTPEEALQHLRPTKGSP